MPAALEQAGLCVSFHHQVQFPSCLSRVLLSQMSFSYQWEKKSLIHLTGIQAMAVQERAAKHRAAELSTALEMVNIRPLAHVSYCFGVWGFFFPLQKLSLSTTQQ